ncbi:MAG: mannonate dehydratase [Opitutaceae bacterium]|nr:mannonate dehydratase [Opitutaceae bacterium]
MKRTHRLSRRQFIGGTLAAAGAAAVPLPSVRAAAPVRRAPSPIRLGMNLGIVLEEEMLRFVKQLGIEWISAVLPASQGALLGEELMRATTVPGRVGAMGGIGGPPGGPSGPWKEEEVRRVIRRVEDAGLRLGNLMLHAFPNAIAGTPERDRDLENVRESIRIAGRLGIPVVEYNFFSLRNVEGLYQKPGRGGASYRAFDDGRVRDQSPLPVLGPRSDEETWANLRYFLQAAVPAAEEAGVRLALHPNDPPVPTYRGVTQPAASIAQWKRLVEFLPSPANGITFDTGVTAELNGDVVELIRYFAARDCINHVHFRNVRTAVPARVYEETFVDEGQVDMAAAMRALHESGYPRMVVPDHTPAIAGDPKSYGGWGYALGYMRGLVQSL